MEQIRKEKDDNDKIDNRYAESLSGEYAKCTVKVYFAAEDSDIEPRTIIKQIAESYSRSTINEKS